MPKNMIAGVIRIRAAAPATASLDPGAKPKLIV
jgi:hypothetical protein